MFPTLYKKTNGNKIQEWNVIVEDNTFYTISGQTDGKKVYSKSTVCTGKNIGKANETSPQEQARLEAKSKWQKKKDAGYYENIKDIEVKKFIEPMLARKYTEVPVSFPCYSQPKLDGIRCIATKDGLFSRGGKKISSVPHIFDSLTPIFLKYDLILDGELYNHTLKEDFNTIVSLCKRTKPSDKDIEDSKKYIQYHIYDVVNCDLSFESRYNMLQLLKDIDYIKIVDTSLVDSQFSLDNLYSQYIELGYEGQMIRKDEKYEIGRRSKYLLKRKEFIDEEFKIVDILEGIGNRSGMAGKVVLEGIYKSFEAGIRGNQEYFVELLENKNLYIGSMATVRYQNMTPDGSYRFPVMITIRDYE